LRTIVLLLVLCCPAIAADLYQAPDLSEWYRSLMMPDMPNVSCCGAGDAYESRTETDDAGNLIAVIIDTRPDVRKLPDGSTIVRRHIKPGTRYVIPPSKIRKHPIPNPTDTDIVFIGYGDNVLCYEPIARI
jgi:hypothetical protein